jgi:hypothetical protein
MDGAYRSRAQGTNEGTMSTRPHVNWGLLSALLALALGLLLEQVALAANDRELERIALLLIIYGLVCWLYARPAVLTWRDRTVRALQSWRSDSIYKK